MIGQILIGLAIIGLFVLFILDRRRERSYKAFIKSSKITVKRTNPSISAHDICSIIEGKTGKEEISVSKVES